MTLALEFGLDYAVLALLMIRDTVKQCIEHSLALHASNVR